MRRSNYPFNLAAFDLATNPEEHPYLRLAAIGKILARKCIIVKENKVTTRPWLLKVDDSTKLTFMLNQPVVFAPNSSEFVQYPWTKGPAPLKLPVSKSEFVIQNPDGDASLPLSSEECVNGVKNNSHDPYADYFANLFGTQLQSRGVNVFRRVRS